jgi:ADP-ribosylglycohydrolase
MIGAIIGDIVGSPYEFDRGEKIKDFGPLFIDESEYTKNKKEVTYFSLLCIQYSC